MTAHCVQCIFVSVVFVWFYVSRLTWRWGLTTKTSRLAGCCWLLSMWRRAERPPCHCGFTHQMFNKWSLAVVFTLLLQLRVWRCSIRSGWLPLTHSSRICQGVVWNSGSHWRNGSTHHLLSITPWQPVERRPKGSWELLVNQHSRYGGKWEYEAELGHWSWSLDLAVTLAELLLSHSGTSPWKHFSPVIGSWLPAASSF